MVQAADNFGGDLAQDSSRMKFLCSMKDNAIEEVFTCNELLDYCNNSEDNELAEWKLRPLQLIGAHFLNLILTAMVYLSTLESGGKMER